MFKKTARDLTRLIHIATSLCIIVALSSTVQSVLAIIVWHKVLCQEREREEDYINHIAILSNQGLAISTLGAANITPGN